MLKILFGILLFLVIYSPLAVAGAEEDQWTTQDTVLELVYLGLHIVDWQQTLKIADNPDVYHERNRLLGPHPSRARVNAHFASLAVIHATVAYFMPRSGRNIFFATTISFEAGVIYGNHAIGLSAKARF